MREPVASSTEQGSRSPLRFGSSADGRATSERALPQIPDHELLEPVGRGAYGEVWLARSVVGTLRAVKVVYRQDFWEDHPYDREFKGMRKFEPVSRSHPGLVNILQIGRNDAEGYFYYVMELADDASGVEDGGQGGGATAGRCDGATVARGAEGGQTRYRPHTLRHDLRTRGRLPAGECVELGLALTSALQHLHEHGLVHRDIKPSNIIFVDGQPKLADIGLVTETGDSQSIVGTEGYLPPEGPGTAQADIYSLGKALYEVSTGQDRRQFPDLPVELKEWPDAPGLRDLNEVVLTACAKDAARRYHSAAETHADLLRLQAGKSVRRWGNLGRPAERTKRAWPLLASLLLLLLVVPWVLWQKESRPPAFPAEKASVFVLPFRSDGSNGVPDDLRGRITDAFIDSLAVIDGVRRSPRKSGWVHQDEDMLRRSLAKTNDMRHILTGRISGSGDGLTLTLRLNKRGEDKPVWTDSFSGTTNDMVAVERRALSRIAEFLELEVTLNEQWKMDLLLTNNLEALKWMRQAEAAYQNKAGTQVGFLEIQTLAQKALELDPNYLNADFQDVLVLRDQAMNRTSRESWPSIGMRLEKILAQDDTHAATLDQMCGYTLFFKHDWQAFWPLVERLLTASDPQRREWLAALFYRIHGWFEEARIHQNRSEDPEPTEFVHLFHASQSRRVDRRYAEATQVSRRMLELYPSNSFGYYSLALSLVEGGDFAPGFEAIQKVAGGFLQLEMTGLKGYAYAKMGQPDKAREILRELMDLRRTGSYVQPYSVARVYAALGEKEKALEELEWAYADRSEYLLLADAGGLRTDAAWDSLQDEPRYWQLCDHLGLGKNQWPRPKPKRLP